MNTINQVSICNEIWLGFYACWNIGCTGKWHKRATYDNYIDKHYRCIYEGQTKLSELWHQVYHSWPYFDTFNSFVGQKFCSTCKVQRQTTLKVNFRSQTTCAFRLHIWQVNKCTRQEAKQNNWNSISYVFCVKFLVPYQLLWPISKFRFGSFQLNVKSVSFDKHFSGPYWNKMLAGLTFTKPLNSIRVFPSN